MNHDEFIRAYYDVLKRALYFAEKARREGLLALEEEIITEKADNRDIFEYGMRFTVDGCDSIIIDKILSNIIKQEKDSNVALLKTIQKEAVLSIQDGTNPRLFILLLNSYVDIPLDDPEFKKFFQD